MLDNEDVYDGGRMMGATAARFWVETVQGSTWQSGESTPSCIHSPLFSQISLKIESRLCPCVWFRCCCV